MTPERLDPCPLLTLEQLLDRFPETTPLDWLVMIRHHLIASELYPRPRAQRGVVTDLVIDRAA